MTTEGSADDEPLDDRAGRVRADRDGLRTGEPLTLEEGLARIRDLGDEGRWDEALEVAEELVAAYSESAEAVLWRGIAYRGIDEAQAARADSERAVALDPANLRAQYLLALADVPDYDLQALEAAMRPFVDLCADAVAANLDNAEAYLHRAFALNMIGETAAAEADLRRALELDPENMETLNALAGLLRADRRAEAIALIERVIELRPLNVYAHEDLGCRYEADGRSREAIEQYELSAEINPRRARPHLLMASVYWTGLGDIDAALAAVERALEIEPGDVASLITKARVLLEGRGDAEAALAFVDEALAIAGDDPFLLTTRGLALQALGRDEEALETLSAAIDRSPVDFTYRPRLERAKLLYKSGRYVEVWQDVHVIDREMEPYGVFPHEDFREQLQQAMPEPEPQEDDAPAASPEEGN